MATVVPFQVLRTNRRSPVEGLGEGLAQLGRSVKDIAQRKALQDAVDEFLTGERLDVSGFVAAGTAAGVDPNTLLATVQPFQAEQTRQRNLEQVSAMGPFLQEQGLLPEGVDIVPEAFGDVGTLLNVARLGEDIEQFQTQFEEGRRQFDVTSRQQGDRIKLERDRLVEEVRSNKVDENLARRRYAAELNRLNLSRKQFDEEVRQFDEELSLRREELDVTRDTSIRKQELAEKREKREEREGRETLEIKREANRISELKAKGDTLTEGQRDVQAEIRTWGLENNSLNRARARTLINGRSQIRDQLTKSFTKSVGGVEVLIEGGQREAFNIAMVRAERKVMIDGKPPAAAATEAFNEIREGTILPSSLTNKPDLKASEIVDWLTTEGGFDDATARSYVRWLSEQE